MRHDPTLPEQRAWVVLRRFRRVGFPFRRQHPLAELTVDFARTKARLVIEVDRPLHDEPGQKARDAARDRRLVAAGWQVVRFSDEETRDADGMFARIAVILGLTD